MKRAKATPGHRGPVATYPWKEWFGKKGTETILKQGKDFTCKVKSLGVQIRRMASIENLQISVYLKDKSIEIVNRGPRGEKAKAKPVAKKPVVKRAVNKKPSKTAKKKAA